MRSRIVLAAACFVGTVALLRLAAISGFVPLPGLGSSAARPPCEELPSAAVVASALDRHPDVTDGLRSAVPGARVGVASPCNGRYADRSLMRVTVSDADAKDQVSDWLSVHDAYGVPLEVTVS